MKYRALLPAMDERHRRLWAGTEARALGRGGTAVVARATGLARNTVVRGLAELAQKGALSPSRVRRPGAGRKRATVVAPGLATALEELVEPVTRGDPESPLRWTIKSTRHLAEELNTQGYEVSHTLVAGLLHDLEYSLQANRKTLEGARHPDRNAQFEHINEAVKAQLKCGQPAISVDTKKKELVGRFKNAGQTWRPQGTPRVDDATGAAAAYFMVNCAHPDHFAPALGDAAWTRRIRGIRCNASRKSHAELDASPRLDAGDPVELAGQYATIRTRLPWLNVFGGCCGSDLRHVTQIAGALAT